MKTTACKNFEQELVLYYYGELSGAERSAVEAHVQSCAPCRLYLKAMQSILPLTVQPDEPPQAFWDNYSRELRRKLADIRDSKTGWRQWASWFQPWAAPILATTAVVVLALSLTLSKGFWRAREAPPDDEGFMEVLSMAENLEFYTNMELLDTLDLLEFLGSQGNGTA